MKELINRDVLEQDIAETIVNWKDISYSEACSLVDDELIEAVLDAMFKAECEIIQERIG